MLEIEEKSFKTIINEIKNEISNTQIEIFQNANMSLLKLYYLICSQNKKVQTASAQIPWSHNMLILDKIKDNNKRI